VRSSPWRVLLVAGIVAGAALRAWQIGSQVLIEDEWHAIHKLLHADALDIFTHLGHSDYSIPLTLYYGWLYHHSGLSEWSMHWPSLAAAIALLIAGPRLIARDFSLPVRSIWVGLVAVSPLLVYHAKIARPYALTSLLTFVAIVAFRNWWRGRSRLDAAVYVASTFLAGWLHLVALTFALLPFLHYAVSAIAMFARATAQSGSGTARERGAQLRTDIARLFGLAAVTGIALALVLLPPLVVDFASLSAKAAQDRVTAESLYRTWLMLAGTSHGIVAALAAIAAAWGFVRIRARDAELAAYLATIVAGIAVVAASGAMWISHPLVLARYSIPALPFLLLFAAEGVVDAVERLARPTLATFATASMLIGVLVSGPLPAQWHYPNQFWGHMLYHFDYDRAHNPHATLVPDGPVPAFYALLRQLPPRSITLVEMPWRLESQFNSQPIYQAVHRQWIRIGLVTPVCGSVGFGEYGEDEAGMRMRQFVHLSALLRGETAGVDYLVVHRRAAGANSPWPDVQQCLPQLARRFGDPVYGDAQITVFGLSRAAAALDASNAVRAAPVSPHSTDDTPAGARP